MVAHVQNNSTKPNPLTVTLATADGTLIGAVTATDAEKAADAAVSLIRKRPFLAAGDVLRCYRAYTGEGPLQPRDTD